MDRSSLIAKIQSISQGLDTVLTTDLSFYDKVLLKYKCQLFENFKKALVKDQTETEFKADLAQMLEENWRLVKNSMCCYTALPQDETTLFLCDIAVWLAEKTDKKAINFLMPTIHTESICANYNDLDALPLKEVLCTHIVSESTDYLIPVRLLFVPAYGQYQNYNPYYDYSIEDGTPELTLGEQRRLKKYSKETEELVEVEAELAILIEDSVFDRLLKLRRNMFISSVILRGSESSAGKGFYSEIHNFREYWVSLHKTFRNKIPEEVKLVVAKIFELTSPSSSKEQNEQRTMEDVRLCIAVLSDELQEVLQEYKDKLSVLSRENTENIKRLQRRRDELRIVLRNKLDYPFLERMRETHLAVTPGLLEKLEINLRIENFKQLCELIEDSSVENLELLSQLPEVSMEFFTNIARLEDLINLAKLMQQENNKEKFRVIIFLLTNVFLNKKIISTAGDLNKIFLLVGPEQIKAIGEILKDKMSELIKDWDAFVSLILGLISEQLGALIEVVASELPRVMQEAIQISSVFRYLEPNKQVFLLKVMEDKLPKIVRDWREFIAILASLGPEAQTFFIEIMQNQLPIYITKWTEFTPIFIYLYTYQSMHAFCAALLYQLPDMIPTGDQFGAVLQYLTPEQRTIIFVAMRDRLPELIQDGAQFGAALQYLTLEQRTIIFEAMRDRLPELIYDGAQFGAALQYLTLEQRTIIFEAMKDYLPKIIYGLLQLGPVLQYLESEQRLVIFDAMKSFIAYMISSFSPLSAQDKASIIMVLQNNELFEKLPTYSRSFLRAIDKFVQESGIVPVKYMPILHEDLISIDSINEIVRRYHDEHEGKYSRIFSRLQKYKFFPEVGHAQIIYELECYLKACQDVGKTDMLSTEFVALQDWAKEKFLTLKKQKVKLGNSAATMQTLVDIYSLDSRGDRASFFVQVDGF